jgi:CRP/FNR family cyclic AMP-dependent transcriptional regulator
MNATLGSCPCNRPCNGKDLNSRLMQAGEEFRFKRGEQLWRQGDSASFLASVCTGVVKVAREWPDGREMVLDLAFRGEMLGEQAAREGSVRVGTATALSAGRAIRVPADKLRRMLRDDPALSAVLLDVSLKRQGSFSRRLDEMAHGPVENRLARVLLRIGQQVGLQDARGTFVPVKLSRGDLADMVGCRVETTIRVMTRWQRQGVLETQREGIVLKDVDQLEEAARMTA